MISEELKKKAKELTMKAREKNLLVSYEDFCKTDLAKETALTQEEIDYYNSLKGGKVDERQS